MTSRLLASGLGALHLSASKSSQFRIPPRVLPSSSSATQVSKLSLPDTLEDLRVDSTTFESFETFGPGFLLRQSMARLALFGTNISQHIWYSHANVGLLRPLPLVPPRPSVSGRLRLHPPQSLDDLANLATFISDDIPFIPVFTFLLRPLAFVQPQPLFTDHLCSSLRQSIEPLGIYTTYLVCLPLFHSVVISLRTPPVLAQFRFHFPTLVFHFPAQTQSPLV